MLMTAHIRLREAEKKYAELFMKNSHKLWANILDDSHNEKLALLRLHQNLNELTAIDINGHQMNYHPEAFSKVDARGHIRFCAYLEDSLDNVSMLKAFVQWLDEVAEAYTVEADNGGANVSFSHNIPLLFTLYEERKEMEGIPNWAKRRSQGFLDIGSKLSSKKPENIGNATVIDSQILLSPIGELIKQATIKFADGSPDINMSPELLEETFTLHRWIPKSSGGK